MENASKLKPFFHYKRAYALKHKISHQYEASRDLIKKLKRYHI